MSSSSFSLDARTVFVVDASVVINLNASGRAQEILRALPGTVVITNHAFEELSPGNHHGHDDEQEVTSLIATGDLRRVELGDSGNDVYASLVGGSALRTLDDGEAATIAYAQEFGGVAMIDERKARRICAEQFPELAVISTVDMLILETIKAALGEQRQIDAIIRALRDARMRVPPNQIEMVIGLIGRETAATCNSLPRAKRTGK